MKESEATIPTRRDWTLLLLVTALALSLRLAGLGRESIWYDEAASLDMANASTFALVTGQKADNGNPAGYFLILHFWLQALGATIENARALSAVAGALSVPAVWLLARACKLSRGVGLLAALLVAVSPPLVYLGQEARVFALFATVATLAAAAASRAERVGSVWPWVGFALAGAALVHLHYYGAFVLAALGVHLLVWSWRYERSGIWKLFGCAAVVVIAFIPWLPVFRWQLAQGASRSDDTWWQHLALLPLFSTGGRTLVWKEDGLKVVAAVALALAALIFAPLVWLFARVRPLPALPLVFVAGVPLLAAFVSATLAPMIHSHYLAVVFPALCLLLACGLEQGWKTRPRALVLVPAVVLLLVIPTALAKMYLLPQKTDWRGAAALVGQQAGDLPVYCYEDIGAEPFAYYRPLQPLHGVVERFGDGTGWQATRGEMVQAHDGFWLVFYATSAVTRAEAPAIERWLATEFQIEDYAEFRQLRVWRCRPRVAVRDGGKYP